jgi:hypothetical protein
MADPAASAPPAPTASAAETCQLAHLRHTFFQGVAPRDGRVQSGTLEGGLRDARTVEARHGGQPGGGAIVVGGVAGVTVTVLPTAAAPVAASAHPATLTAQHAAAQTPDPRDSSTEAPTQASSRPPRRTTRVATRTPLAPTSITSSRAWNSTAPAGCRSFRQPAGFPPKPATARAERSAAGGARTVSPRARRSPGRGSPAPRPRQCRPTAPTSAPAADRRPR